MEKVISVETMRKSDAYTIENYIDSKELMYKAGLGVFESFDFKNKGKNVAIVCSSGNNAGDGYVLALLLKENNIPSTIFLVKEKFSLDGKYYFDKCIKENIPYVVYDDNISFEEYNVIVDCIFGTGFKGKPRDIYSDVIDKINTAGESGKTVISVDINSGLNGDNGMALKCVISHLTVSIGYLKTGLLINDSEKYIGNLVNAPIGIHLVGEYFLLSDIIPENSREYLTFESPQKFSQHFKISEEEMRENPVETIVNYSRKNNLNIMVKGMGSYTVVTDNKETVLVRG